MLDAVENKALLELLSLPTAPFAEHAVMDWVDAWAPRHGLAVRRDRVHNLYVTLPARGRRAAARWIYMAHMDHPGFVVTRRAGLTAWADFAGGVDDRFFADAAVRLFAPRAPVHARVADHARTPGSPLRKVRLRLPAGAGPIPRGTVGMWDFADARIRAGRLTARACDDVAGVAAVLFALRRLAAGQEDAPVAALLTRAEETGFTGATWALRRGLRRTRAAVVSVETSRADPPARLGGGAVVRVGDRTSLFDDGLSRHLCDVARRLAQGDASLAFTRALMQGGTCEATACRRYGMRVAGVCMPLRHYHNMGADGRTAPEQIHLRDLASLVALLTAVARHSPPPPPPSEPAGLRRLLDARYRALEPRLLATAGTSPC